MSVVVKSAGKLTSSIGKLCAILNLMKMFLGLAFTVTEQNSVEERDHRSYSLICKLVAEFIGDLIFVFVGSSQALANGDVINAAFAHGITIFVLVAGLGHISGGHFNPAVTTAVALCGKLKPLYAVLYVIAQLLGGFFGALIVRAMTTRLQFHEILGGATVVSENYDWYQGFIAEIMTTYFLTQTVMLTAVDTSTNVLASLAIGFTLTLDILAVGPISGASMNPARSFGPAVVSSIFGIGRPNDYVWKHHYIYWAGPLIGALITTVLFRTVFRRSSKRLIR
ncbi:unnamed protein product [Enterobius vermicularis]|uniref:Aquaporin n=1 Tax=Enterobius vermicularis TaxID=51028 RepID=A0A0N4VFF4_ENTVE|nr:unnamed protein product [Enterobius vermicularis]